MVTPFTTQISLYQHEGLRMGASFLLAFFQSLFKLRWSYEVYPSLVVAAITVCCLAIGFPLAQVLRPLRRYIRLALLAIPAFSLGGVVFGANLGFLPQTVGLALGASFLFLVGKIFRWVAADNVTRSAAIKSAFPCAILFASAVFTYSEFAPFLIVSVVGSGFILVWRFQVWGKLLVFSSVLLGSTILVLNTELIRTYTALRMQSGAIVGTPVDWPLVGFIAHGFGLHGGAWDLLQWSASGSVWSIKFVLGVTLLVVVISLVVARSRTIWHMTLNGVLMPTLIVLLLFIAGILYFRYFVPTPFPKGVGNSWSQFKLADWAHPFIMVIVLLAASNLRSRLGKLFNSTVVTLFIICMVSATFFGVSRIKPLMNYYRGLTDLNQFYMKFRETIISTCPSNTPIYLALGGEHQKFRQMAALYLYDREIISDWTDDCYFSRTPQERMIQKIEVGDCVVEPAVQGGWLNKEAISIGPYRVGVFDGQAQVRIASTNGAYDRETDGNNWWQWVKRKVVFQLQPLFIPKDATHAELYFEYRTRGKQAITVDIHTRGGASRQFLLQSQGDTLATFDKIIDLAPNELTEITIESDGHASRLGERDSRLAAWIIRNVVITAVSP